MSNLHSTMLLLYPSAFLYDMSDPYHLHSTMLLLYQFTKLTASKYTDRFTFHYASTLSSSSLVVRHRLFYLHSTMLLLYLFLVQYVRFFQAHLHSTMLLLYLRLECRCIRVLRFTFHYASTLSPSLDPSKDDQKNLHSTMLLLYLRFPGLLGFVSKFTFHYASTLSRPPFPLLLSSIRGYFLSTPFLHSSPLKNLPPPALQNMNFP